MEKFRNDVFAFCEKERTTEEKISFLSKEADYYRALSEEYIQDDELHAEYVDIYMYCVNTIFALKGE